MTASCDGSIPPRLAAKVTHNQSVEGGHGMEAGHGEQSMACQIVEFWKGGAYEDKSSCEGLQPNSMVGGLLGIVGTTLIHYCSG